MDNLASILKHTKLLRDVSDDTIRQTILPNGFRTKYEKGNFIIAEQDKVETVKILLSGKVNTMYSFPDGNYNLVSAELPPQILALDIIATKTRIAPYCAVAAKKSTVFSFPADIIFQPGKLPETERQSVLRQLLSMLSHMHIQKEKHLIILSKNGLRDRILTYLSMQSVSKKSNRFTIPFSREEMSAYLCVNRSALSHELSLMKQEGLIDFSKNQFTLLRPDK